MKTRSVKLFFILLFFSVLFSAAASENTLLVHKTEYFDIIYAKSSEVSAALLAEHADSYAEEISSRLNKKPPKRMPVYIVSDKEDLNGYFTSSPYGRIVLFDTLPSEGQLANLGSVILKVFYHELTHAISLNYILPLLPLSFTEGAAVLFESFDGMQGRLNDPLLYHHLMQGKIEGVSPSWKQAAGHRDVYPGGFWGYIYGAGFADYLQKIYGMETYSQYWHSSFYLFPRGKTKKIFNKKLDELWNNFIESIYFPQEVRLPVPAIKGVNKSGFSVTASNENGFACFDFAKKEVVFYTSDGTRKKLFTANSTLSRLSFSQDGNRLLVTDIVNTLKNEKYRVSVFDLKNGTFLHEQYLSIRDAAFCGADTICGVEVNAQFSSLVLIKAGDAAEKKEVLFQAGPGKPYSALYNPVFAGKNKIAFLAADGLKRDILIMDTVSREIKKLEFETPLSAIRYLQTNNSEQEPVLTFSWADKRMLYRSGIYTVKTNTLKVLQNDISGGTFFPVVLSKSSPDEVFYVGVHSKYNSLYKIKESAFSGMPVTLKKLNADDVNGTAEVSDAATLNAKKYNYFSWLWKVSPSPVIKLPSDFKKFEQIGLGIKLSGIDASTFLEFSATSVFYFKPFFYQGEFGFKINSKPANFELDLYDINNGFKYRKTGITAGTEAVFPTKSIYRNFYLSAGSSFEAFSFFPADFGKNKTLYAYKLTDHILSEEISAGYSYRKTKERLASDFFAKDTRSVKLNVGLKHAVHFKSKLNAVIVQGLASFKTPVVPLNLKLSSYSGYNAYFDPQEGAYAFFGNTAFAGMGSFLPAMPEYDAVKRTIQKHSGKIAYGFGLDTELTFFSYEIQTGSCWLPIFFNRVNISAGYKNAINFLDIASGKPSLYQSAYGRITLRVSGIITIGAEYAHPLEKGVKMGKFNAVISADL